MLGGISTSVSVEITAVCVLLAVICWSWQFIYGVM